MKREIKIVFNLNRYRVPINTTKTISVSIILTLNAIHAVKTCGIIQVKLYLFLTSVPDAGEGKLQDLPALPLVKVEVKVVPALSFS